MSAHSDDAPSAESTTTIRVTRPVQNALFFLKEEGDSYNDVIRRLLEDGHAEEDGEEDDPQPGHEPVGEV